MGEAKLRWVMVPGEDEPASVSRFVGVRPRPECTCPVCCEPVVLKLGSKIAHHAAHKPDSACSARGESAAHINTKVELWRALRAGGSVVEVSIPCQRCGRLADSEFALNWTRAELECRIGQRRPDILLFSGKEPVLAVEVTHTNGLDDERRAALKQLCRYWLEVGTGARPRVLSACVGSAQSAVTYCPDCRLAGVPVWMRRGQYGTRKVLYTIDERQDTALVPGKWALVRYVEERGWGPRRLTTFQREVLGILAECDVIPWAQRLYRKSRVGQPLGAWYVTDGVSEARMVMELSRKAVGLDYDECVGAQLGARLRGV